MNIFTFAFSFVFFGFFSARRTSQKEPHYLVNGTEANDSK